MNFQKGNVIANRGSWIEYRESKIDKRITMDDTLLSH
jgi:hypothetical protein